MAPIFSKKIFSILACSLFVFLAACDHIANTEIVNITSFSKYEEGEWVLYHNASTNIDRAELFAAETEIELHSFTANIDPSITVLDSIALQLVNLGYSLNLGTVKTGGQIVKGLHKNQVVFFYYQKNTYVFNCVYADGTQGELRVISPHFDYMVVNPDGTTYKKIGESMPIANSSTNTSNDYILPYSNSQLLTDDDLRYLTATELRLSRNEIFARYGRQFSDKQLAAYFESKTWYRALNKLPLGVDPILTTLETDNVNKIKTYEK